MSAWSVVGDAAGALLLLLTVPAAILLVGLPVAFVVGLLLRAFGID